MSVAMVATPQTRPVVQATDPVMPGMTAVGVPSGMPNVSGMVAGPGLDDQGYALNDKWIGRGVTFIRQMPRARLSECLEHVSPKLESGFTAECTSSGLQCLLWMYTRMKPSVKVIDLSDLSAM